MFRAILLIFLLLVSATSVQAKWIFHPKIRGAFAKGTGVANPIMLGCISGNFNISFEASRKNWSLGKHAVDYIFDDTTRISFQHIAYDNEEMRIFVGTGFNRDFIDNLSRNNSVQIRIDGKRLMNVSLAGSSAAISSALNNCHIDLANLPNRQFIQQERYKIMSPKKQNSEKGNEQITPPTSTKIPDITPKEIRPTQEVNRVETIPPSPTQRWQPVIIMKNAIAVCSDDDSNSHCFGLTCLDGGFRTLLLGTGGVADVKFFRDISIDNAAKHCVRFVGYHSDKISYMAIGGDPLHKAFINSLKSGMQVSVSSKDKTFQYSLNGSSKAIASLVHQCGINLSQIPTQSYTKCSSGIKKQKLKIGTLQWAIDILGKEASLVDADLSSIELIDIDDNSQTKEYLLRLGGSYFCGPSTCQHYIIQHLADYGDQFDDLVLLNGVSTTTLTIKNTKYNKLKTLELCTNQGCSNWAFNPNNLGYELKKKLEQTEKKAKEQKLVAEKARLEKERKRQQQLASQKQSYQRRSNYQQQLFQPFYPQPRRRSTFNFSGSVSFLQAFPFLLIFYPFLMKLVTLYREGQNTADWKKAEAMQHSQQSVL
ncbi:hypothetical protein [uncultured Cohaesibacter sp.]|uniref:hypothetical protein n=1 Tax=uncultured Cohaesibacter sp. TaxID=1002546 RepID=UPI00292DD149|nr:hypothetical protein [uncultured Cohaesibacter sp.]